MSGVRQAWRWLRKTRAPIAALIVLAGLSIVAVLAPWLAPYEPDHIDLMNRLAPPAFMEGGVPGYLLGTDSMGRDIFSLVLYGSRVSLTVGLVAVLVGAGVGMLLGLVAGYYGGFADNVIMRIGDVQLAFPFILLAIALMAVLGAGLGNVILVLSLRSWVSYARVVRGEVLIAKDREHIQAVKAAGAGDGRILLRHMAPNVAAAVIVLASLSIAQTIIAEASLSFLGLGVGVTVPTWGSLIAAGKEYLTDGWWIAAAPGLAIMVTVLSINLVGDWLRDALDPRLKGR